MFNIQRPDIIPMLMNGVFSSGGGSANPATLPAPKMLLQKQPAVPFVIGVDLGGTQIRAAVIHESTLISRANRMTPASEGPDAVIADISQTVHEALESAEISMKDIKGIGVSTPGPLNPKTGVVFTAPNLEGWTDVPLRDKLQAIFPDLPVYIGHDATLAGFGEWMYGAGKGSSNMIYMTVSTGIGGGIISNKLIVDGAVGTAGEIGHMYVDMNPNAPVCGSGHHGCLEALASGTAIGREASERYTAGTARAIAQVYYELTGEHPAEEQRIPDPGEPLALRARDVAEAAKRGDTEAIEILQAAGRVIGFGIVNLLHTLNPDRIVLGGGVAMGSGELLTNPIQAVIEENAFRIAAQEVELTFASLGGDNGLIGAAAYVTYRQGLEPPNNTVL